MKLITLYKALLDLGGMTSDRDGFVCGKLPGSKGDSHPVTIKGKRLVLPTQKQLTTPDWSNRIVFHPLYENVLRGESQVIEKLRVLITTRINLSIAIVGTALVELASNTAEHSKLNPDQSMFLARVRMLDKNTLDGWADLCKSMDITDGKQNFVHVFLKRSGTVNGKKHARAGVVNFPVMKALCSGEEKVFGYKPRNKAHREVFKNLLEYIFKDILNEGAYNAGSDSSIAPYTDAMLRAFLNVIAPINDVIDLFSDIRPELTDLRFNSDWVEELDKLESYHPDIRSIPMQAGNEGTALIKGVAPVTETNVPTQQRVVHQEPVVAPAPVAPAPVAHQPVVAAQGYQYPQHQFAPNPPSPQYNPTMGWSQPQVQTHAPVVVQHTKDGSDFGSILQSNPGLAAVAATFSQPQQFHMMQQQQHYVPRFAQAPAPMPQPGMMGMGYNMPNMHVMNMGGGRII